MVDIVGILLCAAVDYSMNFVRAVDYCNNHCSDYLDSMIGMDCTVADTNVKLDSTVEILDIFQSVVRKRHYMTDNALRLAAVVALVAVAVLMDVLLTVAVVESDQKMDIHSALVDSLQPLVNHPWERLLFQKEPTASFCLYEMRRRWPVMDVQPIFHRSGWYAFVHSPDNLLDCLLGSFALQHTRFHCSSTE